MTINLILVLGKRITIIIRILIPNNIGVNEDQFRRRVNKKALVIFFNLLRASPRVLQTNFALPYL